MSGTVTTRRDGHVATLVFDNPPNNHINLGLMRDIAEAYEALDADPNVRVIVLASAGKHFCAGADFAGRGSGVGGDDERDPLRAFYDQALRLFAGATPLVAAVQGAAVGAGLGLAVAADYRIVGPGARFVANFTALGFYPGFGLTATLPRLVGAQRASLAFMTSRRLKPEDVADWGVYDGLAEAGAERDAAVAFAQEIAANAPLALVAVRKTMREGLYDAVAAALTREYEEQAVLRATGDFAEGVRAVAERRAGRFKGR